MRSEHIANLISPMTGLSMRLESVKSQEHGEVKDGTLLDASGKHSVSIDNFVPRFVTNSAYTDRFGAQWNRYRSVQIDGENKLNISAERFFRWTGWKKNDLRGLRILEAGCGAGRFTQIMLDAGATVYALDMSSAVDACWRTNGPHENLCLFQGDIYQIPCRTQFFDRIFCYGVLQHTPDPRQAFLSLIKYLRPGGAISVDCYVKSSRANRWTSKYLWRPITTRLSPETLFRIIEWYIPKWLPLDTKLARVPGIGERLVSLIPCWNYTGLLPLGAEEMVAWAILDTFDALAPKFDQPQTLEEILHWFRQAGLANVRVEHGSNGIVGNATKSSSAQQATVADSYARMTG